VATGVAQQLRLVIAAHDGPALAHDDLLHRR
jgi:hypothetical protein